MGSNPTASANCQLIAIARSTMKHHVLKCWPEPFQLIWERRKLFELRINDRDFQEGDSVELREWNPKTKAYTQRSVLCQVGYVLREPFEFLGLSPGYCIWMVNHPAPCFTEMRE